MNIELDNPSETSCLTALYKVYKDRGGEPVLALQVANAIGQPVSTLNIAFQSLQAKGLIEFHDSSGFQISITENGVTIFERYLKDI